MKKIFLKRLSIFSLVLLSCFLIYYILSEAKPAVPDASTYRNILYTYTFLILPLIMLSNVIYLFSCLLKNPFKIALISLITGMVGPIGLLYAINTAKDPMAGMAMIAIVSFYAIACIFIFVLLTIFQLITNRFTFLKNRGNLH